MRRFVSFGPLLLVGLGLSILGCASNKPPPDQVFLMPAPAIYGDGDIDPFRGRMAINRNWEPCVLYATDRAPSEDKERFAYYSEERGNLLRLGEACIHMESDKDLSWQEVRRISLLKDRGANYPLKVARVEEFGVLEQTVPPFRTDIVRTAVPGSRFSAAVDERLAVSPNKDVYIYVHGYKVEFENPVLVATELWNFLGYNGAFIAYSWPATRETLAYWSDLDDAANSARGLRMLITYIAENTSAETIHVVGYSAGTRLVARMLADLGMYGRFMSEADIQRRTKLGNVILVGSDVDRTLLAGYLLDGALRVPRALTIYQSSADSALDLSRRVFRRDRAGQTLGTDASNDASKEFLRQYPKLRVIDVTDAEAGTAGSGHGYLRGSPWVSNDVLLTLLYDLAPADRGLVRQPGNPVWVFPENYEERAREALLGVSLPSTPADQSAARQERRGP